MTKHITPLSFILFGVAGLAALGFCQWLSPGGLDRVTAAAYAPVTDLAVDDIEVTQSIQDRVNSVPLVAGKRSFVRVYVHSTHGTHPTTALLKVQSGALTQTLLPIAPGGPLINVRTAYNRLIPSHAFLFELPLWTTLVGSVTLTAQVNPSLRWHPRNPEESNYANNSLSTTVSFDIVPKLHLVIASQPYTFNNVAYAPRALDRWKAAEWISRAYPLSQVKIYFRTLPTVQATRKLNKNKNWDLTFPNCNWLNLYLGNQRFAILGSPFIPNHAAFYALVADDIGFMRGCANLGGLLTISGLARTASGPTGADNWGWDFDGSYADWYAGHEVGHAFGRPHVRGGPGYVKDGCGGEAKAVKHYPNGRISPTTDLFDPAAILGFDSLHLAQGINPILGPNWSDMMTYCDYQWVSKTTYEKLKETFESIFPLGQETFPQPAAGQEAAVPVLGIFGSLDQKSGEATMLPISTLPGAPGISSRPGSYAIVLRGVSGSELGRYPFTPSGLYEGAAPGDGYEGEAAYISELVPALPGIARVEIEGPAGVISQVQAGLTLPAVQITTPNGGEVFADQGIPVSWIASDADGDPLAFNVDYSADNGSSWEPVAWFITGTQVTIDPINLPASDMGLFRISASDGIHFATDISDAVFFIPNHPPSGEIVLPSAGATIAISQTISFAGNVYDTDLGMLDEDALQWWSDRDGLLGIGAIFSTASLSAGLHEINLIADDGQGQYPIEQVIVQVVASPNDLPPQADQLAAGPDLVFLDPTGGSPSGTISLDNLNLGHSIAWQVSTGADWVVLSASSGGTPQDITVSTRLGRRDFGVHKALLTFSDPNGVYAPVYVVVVAAIPEHDLFLPMLK